MVNMDSKLGKIGWKTKGNCLTSYSSLCDSIFIPNYVKSIEEGVFENLDVKTIYFCGTEAEWNEIQIGLNNDILMSANIKFVNSKKVAS